MPTKKKQKFTFKTTRKTGSYASFFPAHHEIKLNKKMVGSINDKKPHDILLMVMKKDIMEDGNPNCKWKWITLKKQSETLQEAKDFLNENIEAILKKYDIRSAE